MFFKVVSPGVARVSVSVGAGFDLEKLSTKSAQDCSKSSICFSKNARKLTGPEHFWKMISAKCARDCSESSIPHIKL